MLELTPNQIENIAEKGVNPNAIYNLRIHIHNELKAMTKPKRKTIKA